MMYIVCQLPITVTGALSIRGRMTITPSHCCIVGLLGWIVEAVTDTAVGDTIVGLAANDGTAFAALNVRIIESKELFTS